MIEKEESNFFQAKEAEVRCQSCGTIGRSPRANAALHDASGLNLLDGRADEEQKPTKSGSNDKQ
jgi:hypothetical protein